MRRLDVALVVVGFALAGCEAVLGVEDVVLDGEGGAGGAGAGSTNATSLGVGAGFAVSGSVASASTGVDTGTEATASTGTGTTCQPDLPACAGAVPSAFEGPPDLDGGWTINRRKAEVKGQKLELDPDDDVASVRSKGTIETNAACAVWITLVGSEESASAGIAVGSGLPGSEPMGLYRTGNAVVASSQGQAVGTLSLPDPAAHHVLRLRFDGAGSVAADVKSEGGCYEQVGTAASITGSPPSVTLFQVGEQGKTQLDDFCR